MADRVLPSPRFEFKLPSVLLIAGLFQLSHHSILLSLAFLASVILHECGHALAARSLGIRVKSIGLCAWGGFTRREHALDPRTDAVIAAAGPLVSFSLSGMLWPWILVDQSAAWIAGFNLAIAVLNSLPIPGTDGWRVTSAAPTGVVTGLLKPFSI